MVTRFARQALVMSALATVVFGTGACAGSGGVDGPATSTAVLQPPESQPSVSQPAVATTTLSPSAVSQPPTSTSAGSSAPFSGSVQQIYSTGDFVLVSGPVTYTVVMLPTTTVVNLRGQRVPRQYIAVSGMVEVTGTLEAGKITAQNVLVPTRKDDV